MIWDLVTLAVAGGTLLGVLWSFRTLTDLPTRFVVLAVWGRYVLSAFHQHSYPPLLAGFSPNALFSIAVAVGALALVPPRLYLRARLLAIFATVAIVVGSGLLNLEFRGLASDLTKWVYFIAIALLIYRGCTIHGPDPVLRGLFAAALTPLILQLLSVAARRPLEGADGTLSYIGGYAHEAAFSLVLFTILCLGTLIRWRYAVVALALVPLCVAGILLANYRTTVVAMLPLILVLVGGTLVRWTPPALRSLSGMYVLAGGAGLLALAVAFMPARFLDILVVLQSGLDLIQPPDAFTAEEQDLFNGRVFIWSEYIWTWWQASPRVHLLGFGPEAWQGVQRLYAHNTFISYLYEFGVVGLIALVAFFATQFVAAVRVRPPFLAATLLAGLAGFALLNLATMPLWTIEGLILLAILCGTTWASLDAPQAEAPATAVAATPKRRIGDRWRADPTRPIGRRGQGWTPAAARAGPHRGRWSYGTGAAGRR